MRSQRWTLCFVSLFVAALVGALSLYIHNSLQATIETAVQEAVKEARDEMGSTPLPPTTRERLVLKGTNYDGFIEIQDTKIGEALSLTTSPESRIGLRIFPEPYEGTESTRALWLAREIRTTMSKNSWNFGLYTDLFADTNWDENAVDSVNYNKSIGNDIVRSGTITSYGAGGNREFNEAVTGTTSNGAIYKGSGRYTVFNTASGGTASSRLTADSPESHLYVENTGTSGNVNDFATLVAGHMAINNKGGSFAVQSDEARSNPNVATRNYGIHIAGVTGGDENYGLYIAAPPDGSGIPPGENNYGICDNSGADWKTKGSVELEGQLQFIGEDCPECTEETEGSIQYNPETKRHYGYDGNSWHALY